jgi:hypothetical protein
MWLGLAVSDQLSAKDVKIPNFKLIAEIYYQPSSKACFS